VDSSQAWFDELRRDSELIRLAEAESRLKFLYADVGETVAFGNPTNWNTTSPDEQAHKAMAYVEGPIDIVDGDFDVVLVDGRWRLACGLYALRHVNASSIVMVHDFFEIGSDALSGRDGYSELLNWYTVVERAGELAILSPKAEALEQARAGAKNFEEALRGAYHKKELASSMKRLTPREQVLISTDNTSSLRNRLSNANFTVGFSKPPVLSSLKPAAEAAAVAPPGKQRPWWERLKERHAQGIHRLQQRRVTLETSWGGSHTLAPQTHDTPSVATRACESCLQHSAAALCNTLCDAAHRTQKASWRQSLD